MQKKTFGFVFVILMLLGAGTAQATVPATLWDLSGTATVRVGVISQSAPVTGMLALAADRTYVLQIDGEDPADTGAWFEIRGRFLLYTQNLLEQIVDLESEIAAEAKEPVELTPIKSSGKAGINAKTGQLYLRGNTTFQAYFPNHDLTIRVMLRIDMTGTQI